MDSLKGKKEVPRHLVTANLPYKPVLLYAAGPAPRETVHQPVAFTSSDGSGRHGYRRAPESLAALPVHTKVRHSGLHRLDKGQKTPPFAGAKRRGRNREEADIPSEVNLPGARCQCFFCKFDQSCRFVYTKSCMAIRTYLYVPLY